MFFNIIRVALINYIRATGPKYLKRKASVQWALIRATILITKALYRPLVGCVQETLGGSVGPSVYPCFFRTSYHVKTAKGVWGASKWLGFLRPFSPSPAVCALPGGSEHARRDITTLSHGQLLLSLLRVGLTWSKRKFQLWSFPWSQTYPQLSRQAKPSLLLLLSPRLPSSHTASHTHILLFSPFWYSCSLPQHSSCQEVSGT